MPEVDPAETPSQAGPESVPDRADAAQRRLAEIWGSSQTPAAGAATEDPEPQPPERPDRRAEADAAQRTLAAIWKTHPASVDEQLAQEILQPRPAPSQNARIAQLGDELTARAEDLGPTDPATVDARFALATALLEAGHAAEAIPLLEQGIAALDPADTTLAAKRAAAVGALANSYLIARRSQPAIALYQSLLADDAASSRDERLGYRIKLAVAHRSLGNVTAAVDQLKTLSTELETSRADAGRLLETEVELATTHVVAGRPRDGVTMYERSVPLAITVHGAGHRTTLGIRIMLARAYQQAGQSANATRTYEQLASDAERALGAGDKLTKQASSELAMLRSQR
jgi:tetratricopeptide (TPR) repeat protein